MNHQPKDASWQMHPNAWSEDHPEGCSTCRVCPECFRPRRPEQYEKGADACKKCQPPVQGLRSLLRF